MFGSCHLPTPKISFRFSRNFRVEGWAFLKWLHVLDDADVKDILKDKWKLNRIIKNHSIALVTFLWNVVFLFANFIFEQRTFLLFTRDHNNYWWLVKPEKKTSEDKFHYHKNQWKWTNCLLHPRRNDPASSTHFFTGIKIDEQRFLYIDPCPCSNF